MNKKIVKIIFLLIMIILLIIPGEVIATSIVEATKVELSQTYLSINVGESKIIESKVSPTNTTNKKVTYSSSDTSIATVEQITGKETYYIKTKVNDKVISIEGNKDTNSAKAQIMDNKRIESQKYDLIETENGYYIIRARHSGKVLDVQGAKKVNSTPVIQYDLHGNDNQLWKLEDAGDGYYYIKSKHSGLYLDVQGGKANEGDKIIIYKGNKKNNQKFKLEKTGEVNNYAEKEMAKITAKKNGTAEITITTSDGKTATCDVKVGSGGYGYTGKEAENYFFRQTDKIWKSYFFGTWNGKRYQVSDGCGLFAITHCIGVMTERYEEIRPNEIAIQMREQSGTDNIAGNTKKMKNVVKLYGFNWYPIENQTQYRSANGIKELFKEGGTLWGSLHKGDYYYKPVGRRAMNNGHMIMWYKYENGYFYAKDSARDGGGACKYPEKKFDQYVKRGNFSIIKK